MVGGRKLPAKKPAKKNASGGVAKARPGGMARAPKRVRNDARKPITRQRIIDATRDLILEAGSGSLSKAIICERAGVDRAIIYDHFPDVESCVRAAAEQVSARLLERDARLRHALDDRSLSGLERTISLTRTYLQASLDEPELARLAIRCRWDNSSLGEVIRQAMAKGDALLADDVWMDAVRHGLRSSRSELFERCARIISTTHYEALAMLLDNPKLELESMARFIGTWTHSAVQAQVAPLIADETNTMGPRITARRDSDSGV